MFGIYAAEVEFALTTRVREEELRRLALRAERRQTARTPKRALHLQRPGTVRQAWPRPIAVHAH